MTKTSIRFFNSVPVRQKKTYLEKDYMKEKQLKKKFNYLRKGVWRYTEKILPVIV